MPSNSRSELMEHYLKVNFGEMVGRVDTPRRGRLEFEIVKPSQKLQSPADLDEEAFLAEVKKLHGKKKVLSVAAVKALRDEYVRTLEPVRRRAAEALALEHQISDLV